MINPELFSKKINWRFKKNVVFLQSDKVVKTAHNYHDGTLFV